MHINCSRVFVLLCGLVLLALAGTAGYGIEFKLFIVAGQSNAVGYETNVSQLPADSADAQIPFFFDEGDPYYDAGVNDSSSGGVWTTLCAQPKGNPLTSGDRQYGNFKNSTGGFGPEMSIARDLWHAGVPNVAIFKFAYSATSFQYNDWRKGDPVYDSMLQRYGQAVTALSNGGANTVKLSGLFWIQGESDSGSSTYQADLTSFISNIRSDYNAPNLPVLAGLKANFNSSTYSTVVVPQMAVAAADPNVFYVDTTGAAAASQQHFSSAGALDVGSRFASTYLDNYPVPEPSALSLLALGGLLALRRKR